MARSRTKSTGGTQPSGAQETAGDRASGAHFTHFDATGQAQQIVGNYRPRSTLLLLSRLIGEKLVGTPYAEHFLAGES